MPAPRDEPSARRGVIPAAAGQSLWRAALWTGAGTAVLAAVGAIAVVAVCWLPASGGSGSAGSAIRAGLLTFLAAVHGGITVGGVHALFVPGGMTALVGVLAWRAGCGLAVTAADLDETAPRRLLAAAAVQTFAFTVPCVVAAAVSSLGTSSVSPLAVAPAALILFGACAGGALVRWSALGDALDAALPTWVGPAVRTAAAALLTYVFAAAVLVAGALIVHHERVAALAHSIGGDGWSGVPVLALGLLSTPNAVVAGSAYLAGPGFAVGSGSTVSLVSTTHGVLPAFPMLGALPTRHGASWPVWTLAALTCLLAGAYAARAARRFGAGAGRWRVLAAAAGGCALGGVVLGWLGGGALGTGRLSAVGASPWQLGLALGVEVAVSGSLALVVADTARALRRRRSADTDRPALALVDAAVARGGERLRRTGKGGDKLAG